MSYIDTSVIVAALDPLDPRSKIATELLEKEDQRIVFRDCFDRVGKHNS